MSRRYPLNVILLGVVAALYGVLIGIISVKYTTESVLLAAGITCITVFIVTAFAFWTNIDFTKCIGIFCVLGEFFLIICLILMLLLRSNSPLCVWPCLCHCGLDWLGKLERENTFCF